MITNSSDSGDSFDSTNSDAVGTGTVAVIPQDLVNLVNISKPDGVSFEDASTVTLGAIALQGVRRLNPTLGDSFVVIGMGVLGQITAQLLRASGCRCIVSDLDEQRIARALQKIIIRVFIPGECSFCPI